MRIDDNVKANFVITAGIIIAIAFTAYKLFPELVPESKSVHHEYVVTFKVSDKDYYDSQVSGKYKFDEEVTVNGKR